MDPARPRFSLFVYFYLVTFFLLLAFLPTCLVATIGRLAVLTGYRLASAQMAYCDHRPGVLRPPALLQRSNALSCRTPLGNSVDDDWLGIHVVSHCWPVLLLVFWASVFFAISRDLNRAPGYSQARWHRLISYFYRNRMRP
jgi:hypothetical protein